MAPPVNGPSPFAAGLEKLPKKKSFTKPTNELLSVRMERKRMEEELQAMAARVAFLKAEDSKVDKVIAETKNLALKLKQERDKGQEGEKPDQAAAATATAKSKKPASPGKAPVRRASSATLSNAASAKPSSARLARSNSHVERVAMPPATKDTATSSSATPRPPSATAAARSASPSGEEDQLRAGSGVGNKDGRGTEAGLDGKLQQRSVRTAGSGDDKHRDVEEWTLDDNDDGQPADEMENRSYPDSHHDSDDPVGERRRGLSPLADEHYSGDDFEEVDASELESANAKTKDKKSAPDVAAGSSGNPGTKKDEDEDEDDRFANGSITYEVGVGAWA